MPSPVLIRKHGKNIAESTPVAQNLLPKRSLGMELFSPITPLPEGTTSTDALETKFSSDFGKSHSENVTVPYFMDDTSTWLGGKFTSSLLNDTKIHAFKPQNSSISHMRKVLPVVDLFIHKPH